MPRERYSTTTGSRRKNPTAAFWLDWAPMLFLGLIVAIAGIACLGTAINVSNTPAAIVETEHRAPETVIVETKPSTPSAVVVEKEVPADRPASGVASTPKRLLPS